MHALRIALLLLGLSTPTFGQAQVHGNWNAARKGLMRAQNLAHEGDHLQAAKAYTEVIQQMPKHGHSYEARGETLVTLGRQYEQQGKTDKAAKAFIQARKDFDRSLNLNPHAIRSLMLRGQLHQLLGDPQTAIDDFTAALNIYPGLQAGLDARASSDQALESPESARSDHAGLAEDHSDQAATWSPATGLGEPTTADEGKDMTRDAVSSDDGSTRNR